eukprot:TRINITY_DN1246_c0_g1_i3.p1 TRINITY_DN1246_c0_g1~~TRINITY_DN1246_c0_g1_i3.p1  ORF type:complete len:274 (+),score=6.78 TRINITY_DN1246_c0_g1_i3:37-858(+)
MGSVSAASAATCRRQPWLRSSATAVVRTPPLGHRRPRCACSANSPSLLATSFTTLNGAPGDSNRPTGLANGWRGAPVPPGGRWLLLGCNCMEWHRGRWKDVGRQWSGGDVGMVDGGGLLLRVWSSRYRRVLLAAEMTPAGGATADALHVGVGRIHRRGKDSHALSADGWQPPPRRCPVICGRRLCKGYSLPEFSGSRIHVRGVDGGGGRGAHMHPGRGRQGVIDGAIFCNFLTATHRDRDAGEWGSDTAGARRTPRSWASPRSSMARRLTPPR